MREGKVWAMIVPDTEAKDLIPIIEKRIEKGSKLTLIPGEPTQDWLPEATFTEQLSMDNRNILEAQIILTGLKDSLVTLKGN